MNPLSKLSPRGHNGYELLSALQKLIRRSMEQEALYVFYEMEAMGCYHIAKNRLMITVYEDCGLANPELLNSIPVHISTMDKWYKANNGAWRLVLGNIILMACRGKKTRLADNFVSATAFEMVNGKTYDFNDPKYDFIFDKHTKKGKSMGRGVEHFFEHAITIIESEHELCENQYLELELANIKEAYSKGNAWELYRQPPKKDLFTH